MSLYNACSDEDYLNLITVFIDQIGDSMKILSFERLYRINYTMTLHKKYDIINSSYQTARNKISKLAYDEQSKFLIMLNNIFMYPIRMKAINECECMLCNKKIQYYDLHCDTHKIHKNHMNSIENFSGFKNKYLVGGHLFCKAMEEN